MATCFYMFSLLQILLFNSAENIKWCHLIWGAL